MAGALLLAAGAALGSWCGATPVWLPVALVGACCALPRRCAGPTLCLALGLLLGRARCEQGTTPLPGRPVWLEGRLERPWTRGRFAWTARLAVVRFRQANRVEAWHRSVRITLAPEVERPSGPWIRVRGILRCGTGLANAPTLPPGEWRLHVRHPSFLRPALAAGGADPSWAWRERLEKRLEALPESRGALLARSLALGDRDALPAEWPRTLRLLGLLHVLALSGLHVGLVAALVHAVLFWCGRRIQAGATLAALLLYAGLAGPRPALVRAVVMIALLLAARASQRPVRIGDLLATTVGSMLVADARLVGELSFQLTVAATAGILWLGPRLCGPSASTWQRGLGISLGAQAASLPFSLPRFGLLVPLAPLWNLLAIPWLALATGSALAWVLCVSAGWPLAAVPAAALDGLASALDGLAGLPWRWGALAVERPTIVWLLCLAVPATVVCLERRAAFRALCLAALLPLLPGPPPRGAELHLLDVGQGDAILLRGSGVAVLVDGGGWSGGDIASRVTVRALARLGVRSLDAAVVTHADTDHCLGVAQLAEQFPVREVWVGTGWRAPCTRRLLASPGLRVRPLWAGQELRRGGWRFAVLWPPPGNRVQGNDRSLVLRAEALGARVLLTGDVEAAGEGGLLGRYAPGELRSRLLKVAHHGSRSSSGAAFLAAVRPRLALLSAGRRNPYGHPAVEVLRRLRRMGSTVAGTDRCGWISVSWSEGGPLRVRTPAAPPGR